jgi:hypothetical protein
MGLFDQITGFERDTGNREKSWQKHGVSTPECEEVFFNAPLVVRPDPAHSTEEARYFALGMTDAQRALFVAFTSRRDRIRVISARDMTDKELEVYRDRLKKSAQVQK